MVDLFVCVADYATLIPDRKLAKLRFSFARACVAAWWMLGFTPTIISPKLLGCSNFDFQLERRRFAESQSKSDIYLVADDDCLPLFHVEEAATVMREHPDFSILSLMPKNAHIAEWTTEPEVYDTYNDAEVMEHVSVGGVRFCRKGFMPEWPTLPASGAYDYQQSEFIRQRTKKRVGYFRNHFMLHLGEGHNLSTIKYSPIQKAQAEILGSL